MRVYTSTNIEIYIYPSVILYSLWIDFMSMNSKEAPNSSPQSRPPTNSPREENQFHSADAPSTSQASQYSQHQYQFHPSINNTSTTHTPRLPAPIGALDTIRRSNLPFTPHRPSTAAEGLAISSSTTNLDAHTERNAPLSTAAVPLPTNIRRPVPTPIPIPIAPLTMKKSKKGGGSSSRKNKISVVKSQLEDTRATIQALASNIEALEAENEAMRELLANTPKEGNRSRRDSYPE